MAGLYRRVLPSPPAIDFASTEGKQLFAEALQNGTMGGFFKLISNFQTQSEPAYCGLASLSMVLNALAIDPRRKWKGPWRWFDESMLDCCEPLEKVKETGISFGKVICLAHCAGAKVKAFRANRSSINDFREHVIACSSSDDCHLISSYHRGIFKQTGTGHFSPIGGYHAERDMALILDVARFKYPPHWVPLELLWEAMDTIDQATGLHRGFMLVSRLHRDPALLYTLSCKHESWTSMAKFLLDDIPVLLSSESVKDTKDVFSIIFMSLPSNFDEFIKWVAEVRRSEDRDNSLSSEEKGRVAIKEEVLKQVQETGLYKYVTDALSSEESVCCNKFPASSVNSLSSAASTACCQGAGFLTGKSGMSSKFCCLGTGVRCYRSNGDKPITIVSGIVANDSGDDGVDMIVPSSQSKLGCLSSCTVTHPASTDVLTAMLLALPPQTWSAIKDKKVLLEICDLVEGENLPHMLQEEVLHLRGQLLLLKRCKDNKVEEDLEPPPF